MLHSFSRRQFFKQGRSTLVGFSVFSLLGMLSNCQAFGNASTETLFADLERQIPQLMRFAVVPGVAIAIVRDAQIIWSRGFGLKNNRSKEPADSSTVFAAASLSKPVFACAVLKMCDRGELNLDTPLTEYTDKLLIPDPRLRQITARMVLSHTSGFTDVSGEPPLRITSAPGTKFNYSSEGYFYLQKVVEKITGQPLNDYMSRNVFAPLGMESSSYIWMPQYELTAANGHDRLANPKPLRKSFNASSAGSLRTTATDFARFMIATIEPTANDAFRLSEDLSTQMLRSHAFIDRYLSWGLGWALERSADGDFFWHWGDIGTFKSFALASRQLKTGIVILTNSQNGFKICKEITSNSIGGQHPAFSFGMINY